jgi:hypothetical protein
VSDVSPEVKRYVLCPGITNGRYYSAPELARLYRVEMDACLVFEPDDEEMPAIVDTMEWLLPDPVGKWERRQDAA